jgi:hypothetical protein
LAERADSVLPHLCNLSSLTSMMLRQPLPPEGMR